MSNGEVTWDEVDLDLVPTNLTLPTEFLRNLHIMRSSVADQDGSQGSLFGRMTDFQVWDRWMEPGELVDWVECRVEEEGNLVTWSTAHWEIDNLHLLQVTLGHGN